MKPIQDDLFTSVSTPEPTSPHAPYQATSVTSREAAQLIEGHLSRMHRQVLALAYSRERVDVQGHPGALRGITRKDVERELGMKTPTACARLNALEQARKLRKLYALRDGAAVLVVREHCGVYVLGDRAERTDWITAPKTGRHIEADAA